MEHYIYVPGLQVDYVNVWCYFRLEVRLWNSIFWKPVDRLVVTRCFLYDIIDQWMLIKSASHCMESGRHVACGSLSHLVVGPVSCCCWHHFVIFCNFWASVWWQQRCCRRIDHFTFPLAWTRVPADPTPSAAVPEWRRWGCTTGLSQAFWCPLPCRSSVRSASACTLVLPMWAYITAAW